MSSAESPPHARTFTSSRCTKHFWGMGHTAGNFGEPTTITKTPIIGSTPTLKIPTNVATTLFAESSSTRFAIIACWFPIPTTPWSPTTRNGPPNTLAVCNSVATPRTWMKYTHASTATAQRTLSPPSKQLHDLRVANLQHVWSATLAGESSKETSTTFATQ